MSEIQKEEESRLEQQWQLLEEHYRNQKPIVARLLGITNGEMLVDIGGIQGYIEHFVHAFTQQSPVKASSEEPQSLEEMQSSMLQLAQQSLANSKGKEMLLRIVEVDRQKNHLKCSQKLHPNGRTILDMLEVGSVYDGMVASISAHFVRVDLNGIMGKLPSKQYIPSSPEFIDLATVLHLGQIIKVIIVKKQGSSLLLALDSL